MKDFKFDFDADLRLDSYGYLDPVVYGCDIHFGDSYLYHDNPIIAFIMHQFLYFGLVIIENSVYFVGEYIFTNMLGPVMDGFLNHYQFPFAWPSMVRGQNTYDFFTLDFRNVKSPKITEGQVDFFLSGELLYKGEECSLEPDNLDFIGASNSSAPSQVVISESAASCFANQIAKSKIGKITLDKEKVNKFWGTGNALSFNTSSLSPHLPLFEKKLGANKPLKVDLNFRDFKV